MVELLLLAPANQLKTQWPKTSPTHFQNSPCSLSLSLSHPPLSFSVCVWCFLSSHRLSLLAIPLALCVRFVRFCGFCEPFLCVLMGSWAILVHFYGFCVALFLTFFFCILKCTCMSCCAFYAVVCAFFVRFCILLCVCVYVCICMYFYAFVGPFLYVSVSLCVHIYCYIILCFCVFLYHYMYM